MNQHSCALQGLCSEQLWLRGEFRRGGCSHPTQDPVPNPPSTASSAPVAAALLPADTSTGTTTLSAASRAQEVQGQGNGLTGVGGVSGAHPASPAPCSPGICHRSAGAYGAKTCQAEEPEKADEKAPSD